VSPRVRCPWTLEEAQRNGEEICQERGFHGPWVNAHVYNAAEAATPGPGHAECFWCWSTLEIAHEERQRERLTAADCAPVIGRAA
jgi:hypothetical protein